ncbi:inorganic diphosphatase [Pedobacter chinensis]|uniref:inorganic diphosphatase n=1 Tax=Pedobacter chinensis TaxID=2282421 RepID=A0A369PTY0_9SPHI|nr:inorganic diphosphatase [Pedobacter chinensis]RDC55742.1 inorganic diphosphatase [Pedobacter chinensis]
MKTCIQVVIETPGGSQEKFDYDPAQRLFILTKILPSGMVFPFDFGFLPGTVGGDGDPLDVLVISELQTFTGCMVECRIIGVITAIQTERNGEKMRNDRFLAIPQISLVYSSVNEIRDLPKALLEQIEQFFINYNEQAEKSFKILEYATAKTAAILIEKGREENTIKTQLIQLFLPFPKSSAAEKKLSQLETVLTKKFGGISIFNQTPVSGKWRKNGKTEQDELIVFEVMAATFELNYWKTLKTKLEKDFHQQEILLRSLAIGMTD